MGNSFLRNSEKVLNLEGEFACLYLKRQGIMGKLVSFPQNRHFFPPSTLFLFTKHQKFFLEFLKLYWIFEIFSFVAPFYRSMYTTLFRLICHLTTVDNFIWISAYLIFCLKWFLDLTYITLCKNLIVQYASQGTSQLQSPPMKINWKEENLRILLQSAEMLVVKSPADRLNTFH